MNAAEMIKNLDDSISKNIDDGKYEDAINNSIEFRNIITKDRNLFNPIQRAMYLQYPYTLCMKIGASLQRQKLKKESIRYFNKAIRDVEENPLYYIKGKNLINMANKKIKQVEDV